jgi:hypothetical protein
MAGWMDGWEKLRGLKLNYWIISRLPVAFIFTEVQILQ